MSDKSNICLPGNNSTLRATAKSSEMDFITSLQVAEITGRLHSNVMRDIRNLLKQLDNQRQFVFELSYREQQQPNGGVKRVPYYRLTKKDCLLLASGYNAKLRAKIIDRWEVLEMEKRSGGFAVPQSFSEALQLAADQAKQIELLEMSNSRQEQTIKEQAPKVEYYDTTLQSVNTMTTTQIAKELGMAAHKLNKLLKQAGVIFRQSRMWMLKQPYAGWDISETRTQTFTRSDGKVGTSMYTVWNERGRRFIHALHDSGFNVRTASKLLEKGGAA